MLQIHHTDAWGIIPGGRVASEELRGECMAGDGEVRGHPTRDIFVIRAKGCAHELT